MFFLVTLSMGVLCFFGGGSSSVLDVTGCEQASVILVFCVAFLVRSTTERILKFLYNHLHHKKYMAFYWHYGCDKNSPLGMEVPFSSRVKGKVCVKSKAGLSDARKKKVEKTGRSPQGFTKYIFWCFNSPGLPILQQEKIIWNILFSF